MAIECFIAKEPEPETRAALSPEATRLLTGLGVSVSIEPGVGLASGYADSDFCNAGAQVTPDAAAADTRADLRLLVGPPSVSRLSGWKAGSVSLSLLDPFARPELVTALARQRVTALALELVPRSTLAQKLDVLSSQASLAGYAAVLVASTRCPRLLPMMTTPAGTLAPARVLIIGAGVAGLQAIATAKRLGARVHAYDTRPEVAEQVRSLGAQFVAIEGASTQSTDQGYARALTPEQLSAQRAALARSVAASDVVITTAKVFGARAPVIVTEDMLAAMKPGSVVVDLAADRGGNVAVTTPGRTIVTPQGVQVIGELVLERRVAGAATQMFASNLASAVERLVVEGQLRVDRQDALLGPCVVADQGEVLWQARRPRESVERTPPLQSSPRPMAAPPATPEALQPA